MGNLSQEDTSKFPCKILKVSSNFKKGDDRIFTRRPPTATKVEKDGISKTSANTPPRLEGSSFDDKRPCLKYGQASCKLGNECIFRHDPEHVAKHQAARSKPNEESVSKSRSRGALTTSDSQWKVAMNNARSSACFAGVTLDEHRAAPTITGPKYFVPRNLTADDYDVDDDSASSVASVENNVDDHLPRRVHFAPRMNKCSYHKTDEVKKVHPWPEHLDHGFQRQQRSHRCLSMARLPWR